VPKSASPPTTELVCRQTTGRPAQPDSAIAPRTASKASLREPSRRRTLEAVTVELVHEVEEAHGADARIASEEADDLGVVTSLGRLVDRRHVLGARVVPAGRGVDLPGDLVEVDGESLLEGGLGSAAEGVPDRLLEATEIRDSHVRPGVAAPGLVGVLVRVGVEAERFHERGAPAAPSVGLPERAQEAHG